MTSDDRGWVTVRQRDIEAFEEVEEAARQGDPERLALALARLDYLRSAALDDPEVGER
jgi:hypothetical protein